MSLINTVLSQDITGASIGLVSMGIITALIPLAIAALNSHDSKEIFKRKVILNSVINQSTLLLSFILLFIPLIFWSEKNVSVNITILILWTIGSILVTSIFRSQIRWFSGETKDFIKKYFSKEDSPSNRVADWTDYWQSGNESLEEDFFSIFFENIERWNDSSEPEKIKQLPNLVSSIAPVVETLSVYTFSGNQGLLDRLLKTRLLLWESEQKNRYAEKKSTESANQHYGKEKIDGMIKTIFLRSLKENYAYGYLNTFERNLIETIDIKVHADNGIEMSYVDSLIYRFYSTLFENISESSEERDIWSDYFPDLLKIKSSNLLDERNKINVITLESYFDYAKKRLEQKSTEDHYDWQLDKVTKGIFPDVHPPLWGFFVELHSSINNPRETIERIIKRGRLTGGYSVSNVTIWGDVSDEDISKRFQKQEEQALVETKKLFEHFFFGYASSVKYLNLCLEIAENYQTDPQKEIESHRKASIIKDLEWIKQVYSEKNT